MIESKMWRVLLVLPLVVSTLAIKVPVDKKGDAKEPVENKKDEKTGDSEDSAIDTYLIPPSPYTDDLQSDVVTPARYLIPPAPNQRSDYFAPSEPEKQSDWEPMQNQQRPLNILSQRPAPYKKPLIIKEDVEKKKGEKGDSKRLIHIPSRQLEPPLEDTPSYGENGPESEQELETPTLERKQIIVPSVELQLPLETYNGNVNQDGEVSVNFPGLEPTLSLHLTPPKLVTSKYPTKLYPKKYNSDLFKPTPIPVVPYTGGTDIPTAIPLKPFTPAESVENSFYPYDEKTLYLNQQAELKRQQQEDNLRQQSASFPLEEIYIAGEKTEPETSETIFSHPSHNNYPIPIRFAPPRRPPPPHHHPYHQGPIHHQGPILHQGPIHHQGPFHQQAPIHHHAPPAEINHEPHEAPPSSQPPQDQQGPHKPQIPAPGERTEFRMHGLNGPHSYQFGYDTGKGKNRQFRFEERDNDGNVRGHYGYMDKTGKLRVVNYNADPETGFHADAEKEEEKA